ncbi:hypothetical protein ACIBJC_37235 [Streptomyces sp. NPDC050509]|uniref:hypothetical protein n=1 Tax=Streptomyces sp. NPDC050509 TaxID=3365620 RepID=UPI0037ACDDA6
MPREVFLGSHLYRQNRDLLWEPVSRSDLGEEGWLHLAYADKTLVTRIGGPGAATTPQAGRPTSSATLPSLVARVLELLGIGTGTGCSTALLEGGEVGVRRFDGLRVRLGLLVLGRSPVDAGEAGALSFTAAGGDERAGLDVLASNCGGTRTRVLFSISQNMPGPTFE